ncbi:MAG: metalloregulator ArsR/SmtB family transcription factor, partial [Desulfurobacteriaceae bacterium]
MEKLLELIRLISDPTRYRILKILEERPAYTCEIAEVLGLSPSTVSAHLSKLKYFSIVKEKKFGA